MYQQTRGSKTLKSLFLDIPVIQDLPVGKKMYDHPIFVGMQFTINKNEVIDPYEVVGNINSYIDYFGSGQGLWTSIGKYLSLLIHQQRILKNTFC